MPRGRKIKSACEMETKWAEYKAWCDNQEVLTHNFSSSNGMYVSEKLKRSITYTIEGFCVWLGIARSNFYETYEGDDRFRDIVTRVREECEVDARRKFELQIIPDRLAPLWMSKYGYSNKTESTGDNGKAVGLVVLAERTDGEP